MLALCRFPSRIDYLASSGLEVGCLLQVATSYASRNLVVAVIGCSSQGRDCTVYVAILYDPAAMVDQRVMAVA